MKIIEITNKYNSKERGFSIISYCPCTNNIPELYISNFIDGNPIYFSFT
jgi:hypothetical protein